MINSKLNIVFDLIYIQSKNPRVYNSSNIPAIVDRTSKVSILPFESAWPTKYDKLSAQSLLLINIQYPISDINKPTNKPARMEGKLIINILDFFKNKIKQKKTAKLNVNILKIQNNASHLNTKKFWNLFRPIANYFLFYIISLSVIKSYPLISHLLGWYSYQENMYISDHSYSLALVTSIIITLYYRVKQGNNWYWF